MTFNKKKLNWKEYIKYNPKSNEKDNGNRIFSYDKETLVNKLLDISNSIIGKKIDPQQSLLDNGLDSLGSIALKNKITEHLNIDLPNAYIFEYPTIIAISDYILSQNQTTSPLSKTLNTNTNTSNHPIVIIGAGLGGLNFAYILKRNGLDVVILEKKSNIGGVWQKFANSFSQLQIDSPAYSFDSSEADSLSSYNWQKLFPTREEILTNASQLQKDLNIDLRLNTEVKSVTKISQSIYEIIYEENSIEKRITTSGIVAMTGGLHKSKDRSFSGIEKYKGILAYGISNDIDPKSFAGKKVVIVGHGAYAVENARTAIQFGASHVTILCRQRNLILSSFCNYFLNSSPTTVSIDDIVALMTPFYHACGVDISEIPSLSKDELGNYMLNQTTVPPGSDIYFLAQILGKLSIVVDEIGAVEEYAIKTKKNKILHTDILITCLGFDTDLDLLKNIFGSATTVSGLWINGDPNIITYNDGAQIPRHVKSLMCSSYLFFVQCFAKAYIKYRTDIDEFEKILSRLTISDNSSTLEERIIIALWEFIEPAKKNLSVKTMVQFPLHKFVENRIDEWNGYLKTLAPERNYDLQNLLKPFFTLMKVRDPENLVYNTYEKNKHFIQAKKRKVNILFLPGQGTNAYLAHTLLHRTGWLHQEYLDFTILDPPFTLPAFTNDIQLEKLGLDQLVKEKIYDKNETYKEWKFGFDALYAYHERNVPILQTKEDKDHLKRSIDYLAEFMKENNHIDAVAGFCEGSTIASIALHLQARGSAQNMNGIKFFIAISPWRSPFHEAEKFYSAKQKFSQIPTLQINGLNDMPVFISAAPKFQKDFKNIELYEHPGQHVYPMVTPNLKRKIKNIIINSI